MPCGFIRISRVLPLKEQLWYNIAVFCFFKDRYDLSNAR